MFDSKLSLVCFLFLFIVWNAGGARAQEVDSKIRKPAPTSVNGKIDWVFNLAEGRRLSMETGKPIFLVFRCER